MIGHKKIERLKSENLDAKKTNSWDRLIVAIAIACVVLPVMIFLLGWTKPYIAALGIVLLLYFAVKTWMGTTLSNDISICNHKGFWTLSLCVIAVWVLFSGIGGFSYQTSDYTTRNPMFRDLFSYGWPIYYDLSKESALVQDVMGHASSATNVYYFAWWLPVAAFIKLTHCSELLGNTMLYLWAVLCMFLVFYLLVQVMQRYSYLILALLVLFSGMDFVGWYIENVSLPNTAHLEWWCHYMQYSSNTTQLYWVFNQAIPTWLIVALFLVIKKPTLRIALSSLVFAFSPFATFGMIPIVLATVFGLDCLENSGWKGLRPREVASQMLNRIRNAISIESVGVPSLMLVVFGSFYLQNKHSIKTTGFLFSIYPDRRTVTLYILFVLLEFGIYFIAMGASASRYHFYGVVLVELLLIPLFKATPANDFCMRSSIPPLFLLMVIVLNYLLDNTDGRNMVRRKKALLILLAIGSITAIAELQRNVRLTLQMSQTDYLNEVIYSYGAMRTEDVGVIKLMYDSFLPTDYEDSFFYQYIARR